MAYYGETSGVGTWHRLSEALFDQEKAIVVQGAKKHGVDGGPSNSGGSSALVEREYRLQVLQLRWQHLTHSECALRSVQS